jgi:adenine-specific DNA-methyltransferase
MRRLEAIIREDDEKLAQAQQDLDDQYDDLDDLKEELQDLEPESEFVLSDEQKTQVNAEIDELRHFYDKAVGITNNAKGAALLIAIEKAFEKISELGGNRKAIIFTESTRTQKYLLELLSNSVYNGKIALFNGSNSDTASKDIYKAYAEKHAGSSKLTGSRTADTRNAIVEHFRDSAEILIATEAASEGINLQFCSLVVNYDLPWNPQRIEQRIGRCHRYGQKHDVVVLNFLNKNNEADRRVYELLDQKFKLFDGVFGSSDEVLGTIENGIDSSA